MLVFKGNDKYAYRDPACFFYNGVYHLFYTLSVKESGYMYNHVAVSESRDLKIWSSPKVITEKNFNLNYCSPGNVIEHNGEYVICFTSYPMPYKYDECFVADETARIYTMRTKDFKVFSEPELLNPKGNTPVENLGRMIDPFIVKRGEYFYLFFKQNGIIYSRSCNLKEWEFLGNTTGGENVCVIEVDGEYILAHSPANGISFSKSDKLVNWKDFSHTTLRQCEWDWASGQLTAGFVLEAVQDFKYRYILFFHGSKDVYPETHGNASLAIAFTDDFINFYYDI